MKTFRIKTLGCKVNQCDSQQIRQRLLNGGWVEDSDGHCVDLDIINTCCVTHHADRKSRNLIREGVRRKQGSLIAVIGCYASYARLAIEKIDGVDVIFENDRKDEFFTWLEALSKRNESNNAFCFHFKGKTRAFLKIQDGCNNHCSYCVVPLVRGPSRSKEINEAVKEAECLVQAGHQEIVLTGINLGSFGKDLAGRPRLVEFLVRLEQKKNLLRIRLSSIEAGDITDPLLDHMASSGKLCPHLHIPFQSGDDEVLRQMNKALTVRDYVSIVDKARKKIRDLAITCDFIIGFPAEGEKNFRNSLKFLEYVAPLRTHIFTYSPRTGTSAERHIKLPDDIVKARFKRFQELSKRLSQEYKRSFIGRELNVLFEEKTGLGWQGYSENYIKVSVRHNSLLSNEVKKVRVVKLDNENVWADIV